MSGTKTMPDGSNVPRVPRALKLAAALGALLLAGLAYWWFQFGNPQGLRVYRAFQGAVTSGDLERASTMLHGMLGRDPSGRLIFLAGPDAPGTLVEPFMTAEFTGIRREARRYLGLPGLEVIELSSGEARLEVRVRGGRIVGLEYQLKSGSKESRS